LRQKAARDPRIGDYCVWGNRSLFAKVQSVSVYQPIHRGAPLARLPVRDNSLVAQELQKMLQAGNVVRVGAPMSSAVAQIPLPLLKSKVFDVDRPPCQPSAEVAYEPYFAASRYRRVAASTQQALKTGQVGQ